jgi:hypothetical protein
MVPVAVSVLVCVTDCVPAMLVVNVAFVTVLLWLWVGVHYRGVYFDHFVQAKTIQT